MFLSVKTLPNTRNYKSALAGVGTRRADFVVENKVIIELKALINLEDVHLAQAKNYVVAYNFQKGLLINFGATSLQYKLIFNPTL